MNEKKRIKISVRNLVEFVLRSGNIDNRRTSGAREDAMQAGSRIHRKIQRRMGADYQAEVAMRHEVREDDYDILVDGRADGVIRDVSGHVTIDEIKGVYMDIARLEEPQQVHLAQAKCYAHFYCQDHGKEEICVQVTYCNIETEEIRRFQIEYTKEELEEWFGGLIHEYRKWADYLYRHELRRDASLKDLQFPYEYRKGQKELAIAVYRSIARKKRLFVQAPTGIGKTLSTVFPSLKAIGEGKGEKLFYLTAKTITRSVAEECFELLREKEHLYFSTVTITAKEKLCPMEKTECNPDACPYAKGHYDRVNDAVFDIIHEQFGINRECVLQYAERYQVCPFEFCLDISNWVDGIICDYNYAFDPNAKLQRYFSDTASGEYLFLIDEAHNLVSRAREMFSAILIKEQVLKVKRIVKGRSLKLEKHLERCNRNLLELKRECESYQILDDISLLAANLLGLYGEMEEFLDEHKEFDGRDEVLQFYFDVRHFINMYEGLDDHYRIYSQMLDNGDFMVRLFCIDPSRCLKESLNLAQGAVFFSATLLPIRYYKTLLSGDPEDYAVYANSPFSKKNRQIMIASDVSSRYTRRNVQEYEKIIDYIDALACSHVGNYMVFFPSYQYMEQVERLLAERSAKWYDWEMQEASMDEQKREEFLARFEQISDRSFVALCVLGGIFSEGIDLKGERLEGVIIVGTGLPMVCTEQEILKDYFSRPNCDTYEADGYNYAYQYPGMNKVLQAAGRLIRTSEDQGIILLLDDRFLRSELQAMFPREWSEYVLVNRHQVREWMDKFWEEITAYP